MKRTEAQGTKKSDVCSMYLSVINKQKRSMPSPPSVSLHTASTAKSHPYCCVYKKPGPKLVVVSKENRTAVFVEKNGCCPAQLHDGKFTNTSDAAKQLQTTENSYCRSFTADAFIVL